MLNLTDADRYAVTVTVRAMQKPLATNDDGHRLWIIPFHLHGEDHELLVVDHDNFDQAIIFPQPNLDGAIR